MCYPLCDVTLIMDYLVILLITFHIPLQPFKADVMAYKPKIIDVNKFGQTFDRLVKEGDSAVSLRPRCRSLQLGSMKRDDVIQQRRPVDTSEMSDYQEGLSSSSSPVADD